MHSNNLDVNAFRTRAGIRHFDNLGTIILNKKEFVFLFKHKELEIHSQAASGEITWTYENLVVVKKQDVQ